MNLKEGRVQVMKAFLEISPWYKYVREHPGSVNSGLLKPQCSNTSQIDMLTLSSVLAQTESPPLILTFRARLGCGKICSIHGQRLGQ